MSDYRPPGTEKYITDLPEECIRLIFIPLPLADQMNAGRVCKLWNTVQKSLCLTKKSLIILVGKDATIEWIRPFYCRSKKEEIIDVDGPMTAGTLMRDYPYEGLKITNLTMDKITSLLTAFTNVTEVFVGCNNVSRLLMNQIARLLTRVGDRLVVLKIAMRYDRLPTNNEQGLFEAINAMSKLKNLVLDFKDCKTNNFDLPILTQLDSFVFNCSSMKQSILDLWIPHLEARTEPLQIVFDIGDVKQTQELNISPKVAAMFTQFSTMAFSLAALNQFTTNFHNLVHLYLAVHNVSITAQLNALANLKQLKCLSLGGQFSQELNNEADAVLPQLPTVKWLCIGFLENGPISHDIISRWNIPCTFPSVQLLQIKLFATQCVDCRYGADASAEQVKQCLIQQLGPLKQQCQQLVYAKMSMPERVDLPFKAEITLGDITE